MATVSASAPQATVLGHARRILTRHAGRAPALPSTTAGVLLAEFVAFSGPRRLTVTAGLVLAGAALEGVGILLAMPLLQLVLEPAAKGELGDDLSASWLLAPLGPIAGYSTLLLGFILLMTLRSVVLVARDTCLTRLQQGFIELNKLGLFNRLAAAPWKEVMAIDRARLIKALGSDMVQLGIAVHGALRAAAAALMLAAYCGLALILAPGLSLVTFGIVMAVGLTGAISVRRAGLFGQSLVRHDLQMAESASRFLSGLKVAKAQDLQASFVDSYADASSAAVDNRVAFARSMGFSRQLGAWVGVVAAAVAVLIAILQRETEPALLIAFVVLLSRTAAPITQVHVGLQQVANALPLFAELRDLGAQLPKGYPAGNPTAAELSATPPCAISLRSVSLTHRAGDGTACGGVLGVDLAIAPGELVGLCGPTGAGKSTLLDLVAGLEKPDVGQVLIDGVELTEPQLRLHRARLAYLVADPVLFKGSLRSNLLWSTPGARDDSLWEALETAAAADLVGRLASGLDSPIHDGGANFSAGERQQIGLARALLRRPSLLLLDEATCSLDADSERRLLANLTSLAPRPTILLISHRAESFALCDRIITLADGQLTLDRRDT